MTEIRVELKTFQISKQCDTCKKGTLKRLTFAEIADRSTLFAFKNFIHDFPHRCTNPECKVEINLDKDYPYFDYQEVNSVIQLPQLEEINLEVGKKYVTSRRHIVEIQASAGDDSIYKVYTDRDGRFYHSNGININHNPLSSSVFHPDNIIMEMR
jgi:hypothetical protein